MIIPPTQPAMTSKTLCPLSSDVLVDALSKNTSCVVLVLEEEVVMVAVVSVVVVIVLVLVVAVEVMVVLVVVVVTVDVTWRLPQHLQSPAVSALMIGSLEHDAQVGPLVQPAYEHSPSSQFPWLSQ